MKSTDMRSNLVEKHRARMKKKVAALRAKGLTYREMAEKLNAQGLRSVGGHEWTLINLYQFVTDRNRKSYRSRIAGLK
jgi:roadblock/LC7 domain-containing protein